MAKWVRVLAVVLMAVMMTACSASGRVNASVVEKAIALQLTQVQQDLGQQLYRTTQITPTVRVNHVKISQRDSLPIQTLPGYRVQGTYDVTLTYSSHTVREQTNPFEVYVQKLDPENWALARPKSSNPGEWIITPLQPFVAPSN